MEKDASRPTYCLIGHEHGDLSHLPAMETVHFTSLSDLHLQIENQYRNVYSNHIHNSRKTETVPNVHHLMNGNKAWSALTMESYLAIKTSEIRIQVTTQTTLEEVLSARSQSAKITYHLIPLIQNVQNRQVQRDRKRLVVA